MLDAIRLRMNVQHMVAGIVLGIDRGVPTPARTARIRENLKSLDQPRARLEQSKVGAGGEISRLRQNLSDGGELIVERLADRVSRLGAMCAELR